MKFNFENDDTLHGNFLGLTTSGKIIWKNEASEKNLAFSKEGVRKIVINHGKLTKPFSHTSYVTLKNQDMIPGKVLSLNETQLTLETDYAGKITIPREAIIDIQFSPLGNQIIYRGPFTEEEDWEVKFPINRVNNNLSPEEQKKQMPWKFKHFAIAKKQKARK